MRVASLGAALLSLALPLAPLVAQGQNPPPPPPAAHARLGLVLEGRGGTGDDSTGARVRAVMPRSPAANAGIQRGDVITRVNGTALNGPEALMDMGRNLKPGDTVRVEYRRGDRSSSATLVAQQAPARRFAMAFGRAPGMGGGGGGHDGFGDHEGPMGRDFQMHMMFRHAHERGLQLVEVSKDLGEYFGVSEGLLVLKPPADSASPLKAGDVLLAIDGRKPQSVRHAFDILHSYAPGEKAKLEVMRKKQRTTLTWTAPAHHRGPAWEGGMERSEGPDPADFFELELPGFDGALSIGET
ncbi:MAG TPA: PDZ domain-containing protein [Gemmatimonadales bacterium]|nr:PDZ domain-containing protein [Gemmatimonadales bacterium]